MDSIRRFTLGLLSASALLLTQACGHQPQDQVNHADQFPPEVETRETHRLEQTQQAAGDRADDTLYPQHFDGDALSSLGMVKLDSVLHDSHACNPLVVYMAIPEDPMAEGRRLAVGNYLIDRGGLRPEQIKFVPGAAPSTFHPTEPDLENYNKTDTGVSATNSQDTQQAQHN